MLFHLNLVQMVISSLAKNIMIFFNNFLMIFKIFLEKEIDTGVVDEKQESLEDLPLHLKLGKEFTMRITVLQAYGLASEYSDVFTQFK